MRKMTIACLGLVLAIAAPSAGAQSLGGCELQGTAGFSPGLNSSSQAFSYQFSGALSGCQSSQSGVPTSGTVAAGQTIPELVTNTISGETHVVAYRQPTPTGNGGCASSTTQGEALATWSDGTQTVVAYSTTGALAAVSLSGSVAPSMTLTAVSPEPGDPTTYTINTTRYGGESASGLLAFEPPDPTACTTPTGVTSAGISGLIALGST